MKNTDWFSPILISIAVVIAGYFVSNTYKNGKAFERSVQVKGLSEKQVNADLAVWPISITVAGNDLNLLKNDLENQNNEIMSFFLNQGFTEKELNRGTTNINDSKAVLYGSENQNREFRYIANSDFTVRTSNIEKLQVALTNSLNLISKGILISSKNTWQPIQYSFSGLNELKPAMIEEATKNAREVAEKFALDSNSKVSKIKSANQGQFSITDLDPNTSYIKIVRVVSTIEYQLED
ncbi:MAG: SIMPL domain-containing protein [Flavobacteriaceae bacterium]|nr:SIMPL domain-containing protein [Flavobacteriaceae bacterium]